MDAGAAVSQDWLEGRLPADSTTPGSGGTLTVRMMHEPAGLNTLDDSSRAASAVRMTQRLVMESLMELSPDGALKPGLAASWSDSDDHRVSSFTLREGATFSTGAAVTAADVVATLDALMSPSRPTGSLRGELAGLSAWKALGERTVELTWATPSPFSFRALARVPIFSSAQLSGEWAATLQSPIGSGPFVVESWERGQRLVLRKREGATARLDRIIFRFVKEHTAAAAMMERGEFDLMTGLTPQLWRGLEGQAWAQTQWHRIKSPDNSYSYIGWNQSHPPFADVRVRRALAHLYDARTITRVVDLNLETPTVCPFLLGSSSCDPSVKPLMFSPDTARALLTEAGFGEGAALRFKFLMPAAQVRLTRLVPLFQEQLRAVGATLEVENVETSTLSARVAKRDFEAVSRLWTEFDTEQDLFPMFHSSQIDGGANWVGYSSAEADRLIDQARAEFDDEKRHAVQRQLHAVLYRDQPYLFMTARQSLDAAKKTVHGLTPSVTWYDLRVVWVEH